MNVFSLLKRYLKKHTAVCALTIFFVCLEVVVGAFQPKLIAQIVDVGIQQQNMHYILQVGVVMLGLCIFGYIFGVLSTVISGRIAAEAGHAMRKDLFSKVLNANTEQISHIRNESLFNRISGDCSAVMEFVAEFIHICVKPLILTLSGLVMLLSINPTFSLAILAFTAVELLLMLALYKKTVTVFAKIQKKLDTLVKYLRQNIANARLVKLFSKEEKEQNRFEVLNSSVTEETFGIWRFSAKINAIIMLVMNMMILAILLLGGLQAQRQPFKIGQILASITYSQQILISLMSFGLFFKHISETKVAAERITEVLALPEEQLSSQKDLEENIEEIVFDNVSFGDRNRYYLEGLSLTLKKGDTLGILGGTASGKSLMIDLLTQVYPVSSGNILINGKALSSFTPASIREHIAVATQESALFSDSIEENILWGRTGDLPKAVKMAHAQEIIENMHRGYKALVYDKGRNLSGGQCQRLQLARAFCTDADMLIVDDCISQTDAASKRIILSSILAENADRIVMITSQRPSLLKACSKIAVLQDGKLIGIGTDEELSRTCTLYQQFCNTQEGETV